MACDLTRRIGPKRVDRRDCAPASLQQAFSFKPGTRDTSVHSSSGALASKDMRVAQHSGNRAAAYSLLHSTLMRCAPAAATCSPARISSLRYASGVQGEVLAVTDSRDPMEDPAAAEVACRGALPLLPPLLASLLSWMVLKSHVNHRCRR